MAHCTAAPGQGEKPRFHNPLGKAINLARHLILRAPAVPA